MEYNFVFCNNVFNSLYGEMADKARVVLNAQIRQDKEVVGDIQAIYLNKYYFNLDNIVDEYLKTLSQNEIGWINENDCSVKEWEEFENFRWDKDFCIYEFEEELLKLTNDPIDINLEEILESQSVLIIKSISTNKNLEREHIIDSFKSNIELLFNYNNYIVINLIGCI